MPGRPPSLGLLREPAPRCEAAAPLRAANPPGSAGRSPRPAREPPRCRRRQGALGPHRALPLPRAADRRATRRQERRVPTVRRREPVDPHGRTRHDASEDSSRASTRESQAAAPGERPRRARIVAGPDAGELAPTIAVGTERPACARSAIAATPDRESEPQAAIDVHFEVRTARPSVAPTRAARGTRPSADAAFCTLAASGRSSAPAARSSRSSSLPVLESGRSEFMAASRTPSTAKDGTAASLRARSLDECLELLARPAKARRRGAERHLEEVGDLGDREPLDLEEDEGRPRVEFDVLEQAIEEIAGALLIGQLVGAKGAATSRDPPRRSGPRAPCSGGGRARSGPPVE